MRAQPAVGVARDRFDFARARAQAEAAYGNSRRQRHRAFLKGLHLNGALNKATPCAPRILFSASQVHPPDPLGLSRGAAKPAEARIHSNCRARPWRFSTPDLLSSASQPTRARPTAVSRFKIQEDGTNTPSSNLLHHTLAWRVCGSPTPGKCASRATAAVVRAVAAQRPADGLVALVAEPWRPIAGAVGGGGARRQPDSGDGTGAYCASVRCTPAGRCRAAAGARCIGDHRPRHRASWHAGSHDLAGRARLRGKSTCSAPIGWSQRRHKRGWRARRPNGMTRGFRWRRKPPICTSASALAKGKRPSHSKTPGPEPRHPDLRT